MENNNILKELKEKSQGKSKKAIELYKEKAKQLKQNNTILK